MVGPPYSPAEPILAQLDQLFRGSSRKSQTGTYIYVWTRKGKKRYFWAEPKFPSSPAQLDSGGCNRTAAQLAGAL